MKPILFNTEMVRAILEGRKTVTRRVVKNKSDCTVLEPYQVNDILYVRETWRWLPCFECGRDMWAVPCREGKFNHAHGNNGCYVFKSDIHNCDADNLKWKPSIHMPKEAARIFLRVTDVRIERLQDIQREECEREGLIDACQYCHHIFSCDGCWSEGGIIEEFKELWNSTLGKKGTPEYYAYCWNNNPYVWVIEFERLTPEECQRAYKELGGNNT